jgi:hypothetical protein
MQANTDHVMAARSKVRQVRSKAGKNSRSTKLALAKDLDYLKETNVSLSRQITETKPVGSLLNPINGFGAMGNQSQQKPNGVAGTMAKIQNGPYTP